MLKRLAAPHLPQGAPTSPAALAAARAATGAGRLPESTDREPGRDRGALANLAAYRLDVRLAKAARSAGAKCSRYADDLAFSFSAGAAGRAQGFYHLAAGIALDEGFAVQLRKTRFERRGTAQRLAGLVINERLNVPRREYDRLKAMLHRAVTAGPDAVIGLRGGDARAQLRGRVEWVAQSNPVRGAKLRALFAQIEL